MMGMTTYESIFPRQWLTSLQAGAVQYGQIGKRQFMKRISPAIVGTVLVLLTAGHAKAAFTSGLISMDFNVDGLEATQVGPALLGANGDVWNSDTNKAAHTTGLLLLSDGNPSDGVTLTLDAAQFSAALVFFGPFSSTPYAALMKDGFIYGSAS